MTRFFPLILMIISLISIVLVNPIGEFPLNDDWAYSLTVKHLAETGTLVFSSHHAMSLIWQVLVAGGIAKILGFSFTLLRLLTLCVAILNTLLLYFIFRRISGNPLLAFLSTLLIFFNPIYFNLCFTFMTEIHFIFWFLLSYACVLRFSEETEPSVSMIISAGIFAAFAFLIRQNGLLLPMALAATVLVGHVLSIRVSFKYLLCLIFPIIAYIGLSLWTQQHGGDNHAYLKKFELLREFGWKQFSLNLWGSLAYLGLFVLPLTVILRRFPQRIIFAVLIGIMALWQYTLPTDMGPMDSVSTPYRQHMPFLSNILYNFGLGPITLSEVYLQNAPAPDPLPMAVWQALDPVTWIAIALLLTCLFTAWQRRPWILFNTLLLLGWIAFEILISPEADGGLFDRHILAILIPALGLLLYRRSEPLTRLSRGLLFTTITAMAIFSIAGTHDYLAWNRARWEGLRYLTDTLHVPASSIDGGFEFNGWTVSDTFPPQENHFKYKRSWWVVNDHYRVFWKMTPVFEDSFAIVREIPYASWLHLETRSIIIAKRDEDS